MESGMLVDLRGQSGTRDRLLFTCQTAVLALTILMTTVRCSTPGMPQPTTGGVEGELSFPGRVTDAPNRESVQRGEAQKVRREPSNSASPNVAAVHAPKVTTASVSRTAPKKASTLPLPDAKKEQLFRDFQEWQKRKEDQP
jgi:hypothetical protein